jgi:hypothetical protein
MHAENFHTGEEEVENSLKHIQTAQELANLDEMKSEVTHNRVFKEPYWQVESDVVNNESAKRTALVGSIPDDSVGTCHFLRS